MYLASVSARALGGCDRFVHVVVCLSPLERRRHEVAHVFCQSEAGLFREDLLLHVAFVHVYALQTAPFAFGLICISCPVWQ